MLLATTLWAFALGQGDEGHELVPMGFAKGSMFQPELLVIVTGEVGVFLWWFLKGQHNNAARRCVLPGKFTWRLSIILQHAQTPARGQCFEISQTTSPKPKSKTQKSKT